MFKKLVCTLLFLLFFVAVYAQDEHKAQRVKYITKAPDGSTSMTIYDDSRSNTIELASVNNFYKYQLLDMSTGEPVYSFNQRGKTAVLNKSKIAEGDYELRVYTKNFIITSQISISHRDYFIQSQELIAISEN